MNDKDNIIVIGGNHQNTLGVVEALGQKSVNPIVIIISSVTSSYVLSSKYVKRGYIISREDDIVRTILDICIESNGVVTSIACSDDAAIILDNNYEKWPTNFFYPSINPKGGLYEWTKKEKMSKMADSIGITIPQSSIILNNSIPNDLSYPLVTKPFTSVHNGKQGFSICKSKEELDKYIECKGNNDPFQVQEYIEKEFEFQLIGCSLHSGETIIIPGRTHITTTTGFNNLVFLRYGEYEAEYEETVSLAKRFIQKTGYSGLFSVEFMRGKDGKNYFLEMNFRNDGNGIAVTASGFNLPYIWYLYQTNRDWEMEVNKSSVKTIYMMPELSFFSAMVNGEVGFIEWLKDLKKTNCYLTHFKDDPQPFKCLLRESRLLRTIISGLSKRLGIYNVIKNRK